MRAVPEYDAFGREIGENTLAGLGGEPQPRSEPVAPEESTPRVEPPEQPEPSRVTLSVPKGAPITVIPGRRRRTSGLGCFVGIAILAAIAAGPVIGLVSFVGSASDVIDDVTDAFDPDTLVLPQDILEPPVGITGESMIDPGNLGAALNRVRGEDYRRVTAIDLRPDRVTFTVVRNGRQRDLVIGSDRDLVPGDPSAANGAAATIGLAAIDPAAPARLVRGAAKRYRVRPRGINYVLAAPERGGAHHWRAYFKNGVYVEGDAAGRVIRRFDGG
jgi:hypothetical protein